MLRGSPPRSRKTRSGGGSFFSDNFVSAPGPVDGRGSARDRGPSGPRKNQERDNGRPSRVVVRSQPERSVGNPLGEGRNDPKLLYIDHKTDSVDETLTSGRDTR